MAITAKDVQTLREMTGVGMMDCKKALTDADGDNDKAIEWLREKGLAAQTKKAGKVAAEGVSYAIVADTAWAWSLRSTPRPTSWPRTRCSRTSSRTVAAVVANENPADVEAPEGLHLPRHRPHRGRRHRRQGAGHRREHPDPPLRPLCRGRQCALYPHGRQDRRAGEPGRRGHRGRPRSSSWARTWPCRSRP